jgi:hypothetical protein
MGWHDAGGRHGNPHIGNPVPLSARKTRLKFLTFKIGSLPTQPRRVKILKRIDVDDGVKATRNLTRDDRNGAAARTNEERGCLRSERVL